MYRIKPACILFVALFLVEIAIMAACITLFVFYCKLTWLSIFILLACISIAYLAYLYDGIPCIVSLIKLHKIVPKLEETALEMQTDRSKIPEYLKLEQEYIALCDKVKPISYRNLITGFEVW